jgi:hypothetical protein
MSDVLRTYSFHSHVGRVVRRTLEPKPKGQPKLPSTRSAGQQRFLVKKRFVLSECIRDGTFPEFWMDNKAPATTVLKKCSRWSLVTARGRKGAAFKNTTKLVCSTLLLAMVFL